jgi:hypothetical protein
MAKGGQPVSSKSGRQSLLGLADQLPLCDEERFCKGQARLEVRGVAEGSGTLSICTSSRGSIKGADYAFPDAQEEHEQRRYLSDCRSVSSHHRWKTHSFLGCAVIADLL